MIPKKLKDGLFSLQNPVVKHLVRLRTDARYREEQRLVLVSGRTLVEELSARWAPQCLYAESGYEGSAVPVSAAVMKKITGLPAPDGVAATFSLPAATSLVGKAPLLALDRMANPGNMGTLLRTALAFGWGGVFFLPGSVDPFHEQVVRASRAALFYLPWQKGSWEELRALPLTRYTADTCGVPLSQVSCNKAIILLMSNEAGGVSDQGAAFGQAITIPMVGPMESLNVAVSGAILMYGLTDF